jgi:hypothetical protein
LAGAAVGLAVGPAVRVGALVGDLVAAVVAMGAVVGWAVGPGARVEAAVGVETGLQDVRMNDIIAVIVRPINVARDELMKTCAHSSN